MIYIASPYSSSSSIVTESRVFKTQAFVDHLFSEGILAFSPILYCHPIAKRLSTPTDAQFWHEFNMSMLRHTEVMFVLRLEGWQNSKGVQMEMRVCKILSIPIVHYGEDFRPIQ